jgi:hypothetical protein
MAPGWSAKRRARREQRAVAVLTGVDSMRHARRMARAEAVIR